MYMSLMNLKKTNWKFIGCMFLSVPIIAIICIAYEYSKPYITTIYDITDNKYYILESRNRDLERKKDMYTYILMNTETNTSVGNWIQRFKLDEDNNTIYMITANISNITQVTSGRAEEVIYGNSEYNVLNYKTDEIEQYTSLNEMNEELRNVFEISDGWEIPSYEDTNHIW